MIWKFKFPPRHISSIILSFDHRHKICRKYTIKMKKNMLERISLKYEQNKSLLDIYGDMIGLESNIPNNLMTTHFQRFLLKHPHWLAKLIKQWVFLFFLIKWCFYLLGKEKLKDKAPRANRRKKIPHPSAPGGNEFN